MMSSSWKQRISIWTWEHEDPEIKSISHIHVLLLSFAISSKLFHLRCCCRLPSWYFTLPLPRVINFKFPQKPHQKYNITKYEELGSIHSWLRCKVIILPILTTSLKHFSLKGWENVVFRRGSERVALTQISAYTTHKNLAARKIMEAMRTAYAEKETGRSHNTFANNIYISLNRLMNPVLKVLLKCVIRFPISFGWYAFLNFCTRKFLIHLVRCTHPLKSWRDRWVKISRYRCCRPLSTAEGCSSTWTARPSSTRRTACGSAQSALSSCSATRTPWKPSWPILFPKKRWSTVSRSLS